MRRRSTTSVERSGPATGLTPRVHELFGCTDAIGLVRGFESSPTAGVAALSSLAELQASVTLRAWTGYHEIGSLYLLARHVVPNGIAPVITNATILMGQAVLTEAGLSFLGLGDPNVVSWGRMIFDGRTYLSGGPWISILPGLATLTAVVCLNLIGDGISYAFSPRAHRRDPALEEVAA